MPNEIDNDGDPDMKPEPYPEMQRGVQPSIATAIRRGVLVQPIFSYNDSLNEVLSSTIPKNIRFPFSITLIFCISRKMDRKRDETSPTPEDKQKLESEVNARNLYEQIVSQGDINRYYATSNSNEIVIQDNSGYEWQTLDVTATIKQENEPRTSAVVRISVNDKGAGGKGDNLVKTSVPNSFSVSSKNKRNNSKPNISLSRSPSFSFLSPKKFNEEKNIKYWGLIINFGKSKPEILKDELVQNI